MRKLKVSIICTLAAVLCCAFALLFTNIYSSAFNHAQNQSAEITAPEHEATTTSVTTKYNYTFVSGWDSANSSQPTGAKYSGAYTYNSKTYYETITVPYTGKAITVYLCSNSVHPSATKVLTSGPTGYAGTLSSTGMGITLSAAVVGTYKITLQAYGDTSGIVMGNGTVNVYCFAVDTSGNKDAQSNTVTIIVENPTKPISDCTITAPAAQTYTGSALTPAPTIKDGTKTLVKDTDYTLSYSANTIVGTATITISGKGNYTGSTTCTFKINKAGNPVKITSTATSVVYGSTITMTGSGQGTLKWSSSDATIATVNETSGVVTPVKAGTVTITLSAAGNANYNSGTATKSITVQRKAIAIPTLAKGTGVASTATVSNQTATTTYNGSAQHFTISSTSNIAFGTPTSGATRSGTDFYATNAKTSYTVSMSIDSNKYCWGSTNGGTDVAAKTLTLTINKAGQAALTITGGTTVVYGSSITLTAGGGSGTGAYGWSSSDTSIATIDSNGKITTVKQGSVTITLSKALDTNYNAATTKTVTVTVQRKGVAVPTLAKGSGVHSGATASNQTASTTYNGVAQHFTISSTTNITFGTPTSGATRSGTDFYATNAATYTVSISLDTNKYCWGSDNNSDINAKSLTLIISRASISPTLSYSTVTFGTNSAAPTLGGNSGSGNVTYTIADGTGKATINASTGVISPSQAGTVTVTVSIEQTTNYAPGSKRITVTINKASIALTLTYATVYYNINSAAPTLGGNSGGGTPNYTVANGSGTATINASTGVLSPSKVGNVSVTVSVPETTNYLAGSKEITVTISKAPITVTLSYSAVTFGTDSTAPTLGGNLGGGTPSYTIANSTGKATIDKDTGIIKPSQAGTVTVTVSVPETTSYAAGTKQITVTIGKAPITVTLAYSTVTFGTNSDAPTVGGNSGSGMVSYSLANVTGKATVNATSGVISPSQAGTVTVTVSIDETTNYQAGSKQITVTIEKAELSLTLTYATVRLGVNSGAPTLGGNLGGGKADYTIADGSGAATINAGTGVISPSAVGTVQVTVSVPETTNYLAGSTEITVTIHKAEITLTLTYTTVTYGTDSAAPDLGGNLGNGTPSYTIADGTGSATIDATSGVITPTQAGTVTVTVSVPETTSYDVGELTITVTINKAPITPTLTYGTVTFGTNSDEPTVGGNPENGATNYSLANGTGKGTVNATTGVITPGQAGSVTITLTVAETTNYLSGVATATVTIEKAELSLDIIYSTVTYGTDSAAPTIDGNNGNGTPTFTVSSGSGAASINENNGVLTPEQAGTVTVGVSVIETTNYLAGSTSVTVTIDKATISPSFTYATVTYGKVSDAPEITGNLGNTTPYWSVENDTGIATINSSNGILSTYQAGTVNVTLSLPTGTNYLAGSVTLTVTINKAAISPDLAYTTVTFGTVSDAPTVSGNTENGTVSYMVAAGTGGATVDPDTGILSPTKAGTVTVTVNIAPTTNYAAGSASVEVTIDRCKVAEPTFDTSSASNTAGLVFTDDLTAKLVYTGAQVNISVICPDDWATGMTVILSNSVDENSWNSSNGSAFVVTAARALAGTTHTITFTLKNSNFEFVSGGESVVLSLKITKQTVAVPCFNTTAAENTADLTFTNEDRTATYEYTGLKVYVAVTNVQNWSLYMKAVLSSGVDGASWTASVGGVFLVNANNARGDSTHTLTFVITDNNYEFENGETTIVLSLTINKAQLDLPVFDSADGQNSSGVVFSNGDTSAVIGYTGNNVYIGVTVVDNWSLYMGADLSDGINGTTWAAADGRALTVDAADALAGTTYTVIFTITDDNYIFSNEETEVTLSLVITAKSITEDEITISLDEYSVVYNGLAQVPEVTLDHEGALLAPEFGTDFAVKFINTAGAEVAEPTDAGSYTVVVSGLGNYAGESNTIKFVISAAELTSATITLEQTEYGYDGKAKTPEVEIKIGDTVIASTFYSKQYANNINAGTATLTIDGIINFTGETVIEFTINVRDISGATFSELQTQEYVGTPYTPKPSVTDDELGTLIVGRDFEYAYEDNENAGTAKVIAVAKGNYGGTAVTTFEITARDITVVLIGAIDTQSFDGRAKTPAPEITDYKIRKTLTEGDDFEFVYENNYDAGVATLYIVGQNNYTGTYVFPFTINARSLEDAEFLSIDTQIYDGYNKTPTANIIENGWTLRRGIDYNISYTDNLNAGEATMTIIGIGNYTGMKSFPFTIYAKALDNAFDIDGVKPSYVYTGSAILPVPTVTWNGKTLSSELDYEVTYSDGFNAGTTVLVTVSGKGNYTGNKLVEFTITQATPTVEPDYDRTKNLHAGWGLPEITATVTFNDEEVAGVIAWQKINGEEPKLFDGEHIYGWVFTPTGNDAINFVVVTGEMSITAEPVDVEKITVTLIGDEQKTYRALEKFDPTTIMVVATLNDGTEIMIPKDYDVIYIDGRNCLWATDTYVTISHVTRGKTVTAEFDQFTVIKAIPTVNLSVDGKPVVGDTLSSVALKFADGDTAGTYEWLAPDTVLDTGLHTFTFKFTPEDTDNYEVYEGSVVLNLVVLTDMSVNFYQNGEELFTSDALEDLEAMISDSTVQLTVKAFYSDDTSKPLTLNGIVDGYTLEIAGSTLTEDGEVTVIFEDNGITLTKTFHAQVTVVKVVRIEAELNADGLTVYTDTELEELRGLITVTAHYNNDSSRTVEDFDLIFTGDATKLTHGTAIFAVDYVGDYKGDNCQPFEIEIQNVIKHDAVLTYEGDTVFTYNGEEQVIDSGAVLNHEQDAHITYTIGGDPAAFTKVPEGGKITVVIHADETEDYYSAEIEVVITVKKAKTVIDTTGVKRTLTYTGKEQKIEGAFIEDGEVGAEIVYYNNTFTTVPAGGKLLVTLAVAESENYLGATQKIEVTVEKAKIDVNGAGETLYFAGKKLSISLDEKNEDGSYKNILAVSGENLKITYSQAYKLGEAVIPEPQDEKAYTAFKPEVDELGRYVVNVRITSNDNYETYFGQWLVEVEEEVEEPALEEGGLVIPLWAIAVIAVCAGLSLVAVAVASVSIKRKPSAAPDNDGFYDTVDEETLASYN